MKIIDFLAKHKKAVFFVGDVILIAFSVLLAFMVRFEMQIPEQYFPIIIRLILLGWAFYLPALFLNRLYSFSWSYVSADELISLIRAAGMALLLQTAVFYLFRESPFFSGFPRSTIFIAAFFIFGFCGATRFAKRIYLQLFKSRFNENNKDKTRILIAGAGNTGEQLLRSILNSSAKSNYLPIGFVDVNSSRQGNIIHNVKVLGKLEDIPEIVSRYQIEEIIITLPSGSVSIKNAVKFAKEGGLKKIKVVPPLSEIASGKVSFANVREVAVEDLLERDPVNLDTNAIEKFIDQKKVLITGAAGSIGSELCRQVAKFNPQSIILFDQDETGIFHIENELKDNFPQVNIKSYIADIQNKEKTFSIFSVNKPDIVFHAAAYKHVPLMETNVDEAVKNNIFGARNTGEAAIACGVQKFIFISTDKAINPTSVMGATKRIGEMLCQLLNERGKTKFISVRFGNVLGSRGSVIPIFREQIKRGGPVQVTHPEMKRYFMLIGEACLLVMSAGAMGLGGEVFVLDMGCPVKILDLAREMIKLSGFVPDTDIPIVYIGIRPGEKLFEELLTDEEGSVATQSERIFIAKLFDIDKNVIKNNLYKLEKQIEIPGDKEAIIEIFKILIPNYLKSSR